MISKNIYLTDIEDAMEFVSRTEKYSYEIDIYIGESVINAKSLLGMLGKGLQRMMRMDIHAERADELLEEIGRFCV